MARCSGCCHFGTRTGATPEGWCRRLSVETWPAPLFQCDAYRPADAALGALARRRAAVVKQLQADPALEVAARCRVERVQNPTPAEKAAA